VRKAAELALVVTAVAGVTAVGVFIVVTSPVWGL
jgi:hypothetical protein